jgi:hypothetical protein
MSINAIPRKKPGLPKGVSGNPSGRPAITQADYDLRDLCRQKTPAALSQIESIMLNSEKDAVKLNAAIFIIERAYGKAIQPTDIQGKLEISQIVRKIIDPKA